MRCRQVMLAALCALTLAPAVAAAHGDEGSSAPAPDALAAGPAYFPYAPVSVAVARRLDGALLDAETRGLFVKVALIARREDLGDLADFWGRPEEYARYLARQLPGAGDASSNRAALLVVMPSGLGFDHWPARGREAARGLQLSVAADPDAVAIAATQAIQRTMTALGRPIAPRVGDRFGAGPRVPGAVALALLAIALLGAAGVAGALAARRRGVAA